MAIGWRPLDLDAGFLPFVHGLGIQVALSDPAFMALQGKEPLPHHADGDGWEFPYDPVKVDELLEGGDERAKEMAGYAAAWGREAVNGSFRTWEDVRELRKEWEGPLVLKGILSVEVRRVCPCLRLFHIADSCL